MRPLQLFLIAQWSIASQPLFFLVRLNEVSFHHLEWWENKHNLTCWVPLTSPKTSSTLCTDSLFATRLNKQLLVYVSPCPYTQAFDTDALSMDWDILPLPYFFPPSPILAVALKKVKPSGNTSLLWPHQSWYPDLISLSMDHSLCLPQREDLLVQDLPKRF